MNSLPQGTPEGILSDSAVVDLWEEASNLPMAGRAVALLARARPDRSIGEWSREPLGSRDAALLRWRGTPTLACVQPCPLCGTLAEFGLEVESLLVDAPAEGALAPSREWTGTENGDSFRLSYRIPDSADACHFGNRTGDVRGIFVGRCVRGAQRNGSDSDPLSWPGGIWHSIEGDIAVADPLAEIRLDLSCPACAQAWETVLDVPGYLWADISGRVRGILEQVHLLAGAYGWSESQILSLPPSRRALYLDLLEQGS